MMTSDPTLIPSDVILATFASPAGEIDGST